MFLNLQKRKEKKTLMPFNLNVQLYPNDAQKSVGQSASGLVMAYGPEKKKLIVKGDRCEPANNSLTIKSVFLFKTQGYYHSIYLFICI